MTPVVGSAGTGSCCAGTTRCWRRSAPWTRPRWFRLASAAGTASSAKKAASFCHRDVRARATRRRPGVIVFGRNLLLFPVHFLLLQMSVKSGSTCSTRGSVPEPKRLRGNPCVPGWARKAARRCERGGLSPHRRPVASKQSQCRYPMWRADTSKNALRRAVSHPHRMMATGAAGGTLRRDAPGTGGSAASVRGTSERIAPLSPR